MFAIILKTGIEKPHKEWLECGYAEAEDTISI